MRLEKRTFPDTDTNILFYTKKLIKLLHIFEIMTDLINSNKKLIQQLSKILHRYIEKFQHHLSILKLQRHFFIEFKIFLILIIDSKFIN